jgi:hypothetical protein
VFSAPMVRAILDGRKTQTRRAMSVQPNEGHKFRLIDGRIWTTLGEQQYDPVAKKTIFGGEARLEDDCLFYSPIVVGKGPNGEGNPYLCPYGKPGDRLWVRETWAVHECYDILPPCEVPPIDNDDPRGSTKQRLWYAADSMTARNSRGDLHYQGKTRVSIHMPRWASRITLEITDVRVQRLQDISEEDAKAEGAEPVMYDTGGFEPWGASCPEVPCYVEGFAGIWSHINGPDSWSANPWVWAISFKRI